jgi:hypothetical protein
MLLAGMGNSSMFSPNTVSVNSRPITVHRAVPFKHDFINSVGLIMLITLPIVNDCYEVLASNRYFIFQFIGENQNQSIVCIEKLSGYKNKQEVAESL